MEYAVLVDPEKCIGCRGCQVACKRWNNKVAEKTKFSNEWTNPPKLSYNTYTHIKFKLDHNQSNGDTNWTFFNWRCMQCHNPACKEACPVNAITKYEEGPVVINGDRCIGCKFCISACPFDVPKFNPNTGKVSKCTMCFDRCEPACVQTCPTGAANDGSYVGPASRRPAGSVWRSILPACVHTVGNHPERRSRCGPPDRLLRIGPHRSPGLLPCGRVAPALSRHSDDRPVRRRLEGAEEVDSNSPQQGDRVRITSGPLRDLEAMFDHIGYRDFL